MPKKASKAATPLQTASQNNIWSFVSESEYYWNHHRWNAENKKRSELEIRNPCLSLLKVNLTSFPTQKKSTIFSWNQSCQQLKSPQPQKFHAFSTPKIDNFLRKSKLNFWQILDKIEKMYENRKLDKNWEIGQNWKVGQNWKKIVKLKKIC